MSRRSNRHSRLAAAALAVGLGVAGTTPAWAGGGDAFSGLLGGGPLGGLLGGDQGLITGHGGLAGPDGGIIAGDGDELLGEEGLLGGLLDGVGVVLTSGDGLSVGGDEPHLRDVRVGAGVLQGLLALETLTGDLAGHL